MPLRNLTRVAHRTHLSAALAPTALTLLMLLGRARYTGSASFAYLVWNLLLAWLPLLLALPVERVVARGRWTEVGLLYAAWLAFFPNAPYLVSDLIHLMPRPEAPYWLDVFIFFTAAWTGLVLGQLSLRAMQAPVTRAWGALAGRLFSLGALGLASVGIALGRFDRWNSWDLLRAPGAIARAALRPFAHPQAHPGTLLFVLFFAALLYCADLAVARPGQPQ